MNGIRFIAPVAALAALALSASITNAAERYCDDDTARLVTDVYVESIPVFAERGMKKMVAEHGAQLGSSGAAVKCMARVLAALRSGEMELPSGPKPPRGGPPPGMPGMGGMGGMPGMPDMSGMQGMGGMPDMSHMPGMGGGGGMGGMPDMSHMPGMGGPGGMQGMPGMGGPGRMSPEQEAAEEKAMVMDHLNWLVTTLPPATKGDFGPYNAGKPQMVRMAEQQMGMMDEMCRANPDMCAAMHQQMRVEVSGMRESMFAGLTGRPQPEDAAP